MNRENHFFISYPINQYWLAHNYEQLIAFELQRRKIKWQICNLGTGYIYAKLEREITADDFLILVSLPKLSQGAIEKAYKKVKCETLKNLEFKPAYELSQFRCQSVADILKIIKSKPTLATMKSFVESTIDKSEKVLIAHNKKVFESKNKPIKTDFQKTLPRHLDRTNITQISFRTNAKNVLESYLLEIIGQNLADSMNKLAQNNIKYLPFQTATKELYMSFITPKSKYEDKVYSTIKRHEGQVLKGPFQPKENVHLEVEKEFQCFNWGVVLPPKLIIEELKQAQIRYHYLEDSIILS